MFNWKRTSTSKTWLRAVDNDLLHFVERSLSLSNWFMKMMLTFWQRWNNQLRHARVTCEGLVTPKKQVVWVCIHVQFLEFYNKVIGVLKCRLELNPSTFFFSLSINYIFSSTNNNWPKYCRFTKWRIWAHILKLLW